MDLWESILDPMTAAIIKFTVLGTLAIRPIVIPKFGLLLRHKLLMTLKTYVHPNFQLIPVITSFYPKLQANSEDKLRSCTLLTIRDK